MSVGGADGPRGINIIGQHGIPETEPTDAEAAKIHRTRFLETPEGAPRLIQASWGTVVAAILEPSADHQAELGRDPARFAAYLEQAVTANAHHLLPEPRPEKPELLNYSDRANAFFHEAIELARQLYPEKADRDAAFDALDVQASRIFDAIYGRGLDAQLFRYEPGDMGKTHELFADITRAWGGTVLEHYTMPAFPYGGHSNFGHVRWTDIADFSDDEPHDYGGGHNILLIVELCGVLGATGDLPDNDDPRRSLYFSRSQDEGGE